MKPFDLEKALAGHPIVYRNGRKPKEWHYLKFLDGEYCVVTVNELGSTEWCTVNGENACNDNHDLFLAPKEETLWVAVAKKAIGNVCATSNAVENLEELKLSCKETHYTYHQITRKVE